MKKLRLRPKDVYDFIERRLRLGPAPTLQEIGSHFQRCPATVHEILLKLERRGFIERTRKWRGITLTEKR